MSFVVNVLRSRDLLNFQLEFINLEPPDASDSEPVLRRMGDLPAFIVLRLPAQHIAEIVIDGSTVKPPYQAVVASPSRLTFKLPEDQAELPFQLTSILQLLTTLAPHSDPIEGKPTTVIEFPDRLLLVPDDSVRLMHRSEPPTEAILTWTELWQTKLVMVNKNRTSSKLDFPHSRVV
jgi:hypothetical protein